MVDFDLIQGVLSTLIFQLWILLYKNSVFRSYLNIRTQREAFGVLGQYRFPTPSMTFGTLLIWLYSKNSELLGLGVNHYYIDSE